MVQFCSLVQGISSWCSYILLNNDRFSILGLTAVTSKCEVASFVDLICILLVITEVGHCFADHLCVFSSKVSIHSLFLLVFGFWFCAELGAEARALQVPNLPAAGLACCFSFLFFEIGCLSQGFPAVHRHHDQCKSHKDKI